jgi:hypothetical protein
MAKALVDEVRHLSGVTIAKRTNRAESRDVLCKPVEAAVDEDMKNGRFELAQLVAYFDPIGVHGREACERRAEIHGLNRLE